MEFFKFLGAIFSFVLGLALAGAVAMLLPEWLYTVACFVLCPVFSIIIYIFVDTLIESFLG